MRIIYSFVLLFINVFILINVLSAQNNVGISTTGVPPNASAMLDISSSNSGLLIPRIALISVNDAITITTPAHSLLVYNLGTGGLSPAGFYYNSGTSVAPVWTNISGSAGGTDDDWLPLGAANTSLIYHDGEVNTKELNSVVVVGTNAYTDIQTAVNALPATGGKVLITEGTWAVTNDIIFPYDNITIEGVGKSSIINCTATNDEIFYISGRNNIEIKNMTIQYSSFTGTTNTSRKAISLYRSTNCVVTNCQILNSYYAVFLEGTSTQYTEHNNIHNNSIDNCCYGVSTGAGIGSTVYYYVRKNHVHHNIIQNLLKYGICFAGNSPSNYVTHNELRNIEWVSGICFYYSDSCEVSNNRLITVGTSIAQGTAISFLGCSSSIITDNYISGVIGTLSNSSGIRVIEQSGVICYNTIITGNQIHLAATNTGIRLTSPVNAVISNNVIYNTNGTSTYAYPAIMVTGNNTAGMEPRNVIIANNIIYGSTTATSSGEQYSGILCTGSLTTTSTIDGPQQCNVSNNIVYGYRIGLTVSDGANNVIQGNIAYSNTEGVFFDDNSSSVIMGNNANGTGLDVTGSTGEIFHNIP